MDEWLLSIQGGVRLGVFLGVFGLMAIWELLAARRELAAERGSRWVTNLGVMVLDSLTQRLVFPAAAMGMALTAERAGWGLFHRLEAPAWVALLASIVLLDLAIYVQHVVFHAVPVLWRLHLVHHTDVHVDVTTGLRFHPLEIVASMAIKMAAIAVLGPPLLAVLVFEVMLNGLAMFNHSNVHIPGGIDRTLRWAIVTPDMHRIHHSVDGVEHNRNFGFNLSCWDRLFRTYRDQPEKGHLDMALGLPIFRSASWRSLPRLLWMPFARQDSNSDHGAPD